MHDAASFGGPPMAPFGPAECTRPIRSDRFHQDSSHRRTAHSRSALHHRNGSGNRPAVRALPAPPPSRRRLLDNFEYPRCRRGHSWHPHGATERHGDDVHSCEIKSDSSMPRYLQVGPAEHLQWPSYHPTRAKCRSQWCWPRFSLRPARDSSVPSTAR